MRKIFLIVICCMLVCTGCNRQVELTEEEAFKGVDDIIMDQQINIHFALKERPLHELDSYLFRLSIESPWGKSKIPSVSYSPFDKKLGMKIEVSGNEWSLENLYMKDQTVVYKPGNELPTQGNSTVNESVKSIYENAEWTLKPSKDVYHIWMDEYIESIEATIEEIVQPIVDAKNFEIVDIEYVKEAGEYYLRVYLDKEGGISLSDCEVVSRELSEILDKKDPIKDNYFLEVSSPGLDRPLKKDKDFERYKGRDVEIKLYKPMNGSKQFEGELVGLTEDNNIKVIIDGEEVDFTRKEVALIRLAIKF